MTQHNANPSDAEVLSLLAAGNADGLIDRLLWAQRLQACRQGAVMGERLVLGKVPNLPIVDPATLDRVLKTAEVLLRRLTEATPHWPEGYQQLAQNLWYQGRYEESLRCFAQRERAARDTARSAGLNPDVCVLLPHDCGTTLGCTGHLDALVKRKILSGDPRQYVLLAPENEIANRVFLNYWADYITIITDPQKLAQLSSFEPLAAVNWNWVMPRPGDADAVEYAHRGFARAHRQWRQENRPPLLRLKPEHRMAIEQQKRAWGMAEDDWFICLHVRSAGFKNEAPGTADEFRNTPIEDYVPMIRDVVAAGGWVVRMGDPAMPPLDPAQDGFEGRVIDYAHSAERSAMLDVALCASCRLFVGVSSGLYAVANAFGQPICLVNFPIFAGVPAYPDNLFIPPRYVWRQTGRPVSLEEFLSTDLVYADHGFQQARAGIRLQRNSPEEIVQVVREALMPDRYTVLNAERGEQVRREFQRLNRVYDTQVTAPLGLHFAATHADELCPDERQTALTAVTGSP